MESVDKTLKSKAIANYFYKKSEQEGRKDFTVMKVVKLVYISHGWNLAVHDKPLIDEPIEAWKYGAVVPSVYHSLKFNGSGNIVGPIYQHSNYDYVELLLRSEKDKFNDPEIIKYDFTDNEIELLDTVWDRYKYFSAFELSALNHKKETPWTKVWGEMKKGEVKIIPNNLIKKHFISLARKNSTK